MRFLRVAPALVAVVLTLSCAPSEDDGAAPTPMTTPSATPSTAPTSAPPLPDRRRVRRPPRVEVPDVTGRSLERAVRLLQAEGLTPSWTFETVAGRCGTTPKVTEQSPRARALTFGAPVLLDAEVGRCPLTDDLRAVADGFVDFARGGPAPDVTSPVLVLVGHEVVAVLTPEAAAKRSAWRGCPSSGSYAARVCPFDLLRPFARGPVQVGTAPPAHPCLRSGRLLPVGLAGLRAVTVTHGGSCPDHAAVRLHIDAGGGLVAADLELPEP